MSTRMKILNDESSGGFKPAPGAPPIVMCAVLAGFILLLASLSTLKGCFYS